MYSIKQLSILTNKSEKKIRRDIASGNLKAVKDKGKWLITENDFKQWTRSEYIETFNTFDGHIENVEDSYIFDFINIEDTKNIKNFKFAEVFSGCGGLSYGFKQAGFELVDAVEFMEAATQTYNYNFFGNDIDRYIYPRDITDKMVKKEFIKKLKQNDVNVILGGFPCQGFSMSGNRVVDDSRNSLYKHLLSVIVEVKPSYVVMENVEGLRTMLGGKVEKKILSDFKAVGYNIKLATLNAADYGVPQKRKRVIFIASRVNSKIFFPKPLLNQEDYITIGEAIGDLMYLEENKELNHIFTKHTDDMKIRLSQVEEGKSLYDNYADAWKKSPWDKPSCTIKENHGGVNIHPKLPRVLTVRELARLQSFPDDFIFKGSKKWQLTQIGNAVPPLLSNAIAKTLIEMIRGDGNEY